MLVLSIYLGSGQIEETPRDHQSHYGAAGARAETDRQEVHHSDSRPRLSERRKPRPGEPAKVLYSKAGRHGAEISVDFEKF